MFLGHSILLTFHSHFFHNTGAEESCSSHCSRSPQAGTSRPSSSLRAEVERKSSMCAQSGFDVRSVLGLLGSQAPSAVSACEEPTQSLSTDDALRTTSGVCDDRQNTTVLLNATMDITLSNTAEIVTVETKAKKVGKSGNVQGKKTKKKGSSEAEKLQLKVSADSSGNGVQNGTAGISLQTDDRAREETGDPKTVEHQSPKKQCLAPSRIPLMNKAAVAQKRNKLKPNSADQTKAKTTVSPDPGNDFLAPEITFPDGAGDDLTLQPEKNPAVLMSNITCRQSRNERKKTSAPRRTFITSQFAESDSCLPHLEQIGSNEVDMVSEQEIQMKTASHQSRRRETFIISVDSDWSPPRSASGEAVVEEELSTQPVKSLILQPQHCDEETQENPRCDGNQAALPLDQGCSSGKESQKPKKARRDKTGQSRKRKTVQREHCVDDVNNTVRKKRGSCRNRGFHSEEELCHLIDQSERDDDLLVVDSHPDVPEHALELTTNQSRLDLEPELEASDSMDLLLVAETAEARPERSRSRTRTTLGPRRARQTYALTDELPPWLSMDISIADSELGSFLATPKKRGSRRVAGGNTPAAVPLQASPGTLPIQLI